MRIYLLVPMFFWDCPPYFTEAVYHSVPVGEPRRHFMIRSWVNCKWAYAETQHWFIDNGETDECCVGTWWWRDGVLDGWRISCMVYYYYDKWKCTVQIERLNQTILPRQFQCRNEAEIVRGYIHTSKWKTFFSVIMSVTNVVTNKLGFLFIP